MEEIIAYGHPNVRATHKTTMQVTRDEEIGIRADCVIGVRANKSVSDIGPELRKHLLEGGEIEILLIVREQAFKLRAQGSGNLKLSNQRDSVIRKSSYIDDRTLAIRASASSHDLPRDMVKLLRDPETELVVEITF